MARDRNGTSVEGREGYVSCHFALEIDSYHRDTKFNKDSRRTIDRFLTRITRIIPSFERGLYIMARQIYAEGSEERARLDKSRNLSRLHLRRAVSIVRFEPEIIRYEIGRPISSESQREREREKRGGKKKKNRREGEKAHFPPLSGELFLRCLEKHCRYDNEQRGVGRSRKGEFIGLTMAEAGRTFVSERVGAGSRRLVTRPRYEEELFGR